MLSVVLKATSQSSSQVKASKLILIAYFEDLESSTVRHLSHLKHQVKLASSGFVVHGFMTYAEYAEKLLNLDVLPTSMGMRTPLLNLVSRSQRTSGAVFSLPRLITHAGRLQVSGIEVVILSEHRMA